MKMILTLALAALSLPALAQDTSGFTLAPQVDFAASGFDHPGTVQSPNPFGGLHMAHETDGLVHTFIGADPTTERVALAAMPRLFTCSRVSQGAHQDEPCAYYRFPDGRTGPLGLADEAGQTFTYAVAPRIEIDVISSVNVVSCMGTAEACRQTVYFQVEDAM
jgi:hypothetical protein